VEKWTPDRSPGRHKRVGQCRILSAKIGVPKQRNAGNTAKSTGSAVTVDLNRTPVDDILHVTATQRAELIAGMILVRYGTSATYYISWNSETARQACAHHLMLWRAIVDLGQAGVTWLDLGGINTDTAAGVARFKLGLGGTPEILSETWL
jgi:lipid II:glycine glycyltransferase (peptidoglycan interpeptide bridge formation enzyme)